MNENLNLVEILKDCPKGTKLYYTVYGEVEFDHVAISYEYPIVLKLKGLGGYDYLTPEGKTFDDGECLLFPSKDQRDWSKFKLKKDKFDPKTLNSFDRVICKNEFTIWRCEFFSSYMEGYSYPNVCVSGSYAHCIPYNEDTKHLVGTDFEAPEYYRYWENEL